MGYLQLLHCASLKLLQINLIYDAEKTQVISTQLTNSPHRYEIPRVLGAQDDFALENF